MEEIVILLTKHKKGWISEVSGASEEMGKAHGQSLYEALGALIYLELDSHLKSLGIYIKTVY